ncbi:hypothetical protein OJAV_G00026140 [Oryzias javanicus]|uniref:Uncharacterized protein n=1 Tax=Oryzias javanicus TaxID=123683 RepID=A0A437DJI8_ORYJA|nr:hypothetical protein OJAV_G00026140 [Oryzias javanicus]
MMKVVWSKQRLEIIRVPKLQAANQIRSRPVHIWYRVLRFSAETQECCSDPSLQLLLCLPRLSSLSLKQQKPLQAETPCEHAPS